MVYLLIVLIVALAVAPLLQVLPNRRQRLQARLREAAALAGLFVEFRDLPLPPARAEQIGAGQRQVLYYGLRLPAAMRARPQPANWWRGPDGWRSLSRPGSVPPACMAALPVAALAFGVDAASCGVYWREDGDSATVAGIADALLQWRAELTA
jgi:hypothetical protein